MSALEGELELLKKTEIEYGCPKVNHPFTKSPIRLMFSFCIGMIVLVIWGHRIAFIYYIIE